MGLIARISKSALILTSILVSAFAIVVYILTYETKYGLTDAGRNWMAVGNFLVSGYLLLAAGVLAWLSRVHHYVKGNWRIAGLVLFLLLLVLGFVLLAQRMVLPGLLVVTGLVALAVINGGEARWQSVVLVTLGALGFSGLCLQLAQMIADNYYNLEGG